MNKKRLDSWKAIAEFLGRSLRTVQRWHECNGLPVHHFGGHKGSVFAYAEEIDRWLEGLANTSGAAQARVDQALVSGKRSSLELVMTADGMWETRSERNIQTIADLYRKAIDKDFNNSSAFIGLARALVYCALNDIMDGAMAYPSAVEALRRMPQLDAEHLDAKCPAAWIDLLCNRNWRQARAGFEEIVRKRPSSFAFAGMAATHIAEGKMPEALEYSWEAWKLNPLVCSLGGLLCWIIYLTGDFHRVLDLVAQIRSGGGDAGLVTAVEALALIQSGLLPAHLNHLEKAAADFPQNHTIQGILGYAYAISGQMDQARRIYAHLAQHSETNRKSKGYALAIVSMALDNDQEAISWLETSFAEGTLWSLGFRTDPLLRPLRSDPRFKRLVSKVGDTTQCRDEADFQDLAPQRFPARALVGENP